MDWIKVLGNFRDIVQRNPETLVGQPKKSTQLSLLRSLVRTVSNQKKGKIAMNFLAAAMHLEFLKSAAQNKLVLELPDDPHSLAQRFVASCHI